MNDGSHDTSARDFVLAIDFGGTRTAVASADMTGSILRQALLDEIILQVLAFRLAYAVPFPPEIVPARFLNDASLHGAIALALPEKMHAS